MHILQKLLNFIKGSLRVKVTLGVLLPLTIILGVFTIIEYQRQKQNMLVNLSMVASHSGKIIEDNLRQQMIATDFDSMQKLLDSVGEGRGFRNLYLIDSGGKVIFAPNGEGVGLKLNNQQQDCQPCHQLPASERPASVVVTTADGEKIFRSMLPIENSPECAQCHDPAKPLIGLLLTDISTQPYEAALNTDLRENLIWSGVTILAVVLFVNSALSRLVLERLENFSGAIRDLGEGGSHPKLSETQPDEIGSLARAFNKMAAQVEAREQENLTLSQHLKEENIQRGELLKRLITAQEDERQRVARELHDDLGQMLTGLSLRVEAMQHTAQSDQNRLLVQLEDIRDLISDSSDCMYDLIMALRPVALDDLGLTAAIKAHAQRLFVEEEIIFEIDSGEMHGRLPADLETSLYRIYQEALLNVVRHSGASHVQMRLSRRNGCFEGEIIDNGCGFDMGNVQFNGNSMRGLGLMGMRERAIQHGGSLKILSAPNGGTIIRIKIPVDKVKHDE